MRARAKRRRDGAAARSPSRSSSACSTGSHAAHEAKNERGEPLGIVHRDVSPQNVLVGVDGVARVLDFGVAKAAGPRADRRATGRSRASSRTCRRSSSSGDGEPPVDLRRRRRALGGLGQRLFAGDNEGALLTKIIGQIPRVREVWQQEAKHTLSLMAARDSSASTP